MGKAGRILKQVLARHAISQGRLATQMGISRSNVYRWANELRDPGSETVLTIAQALAVLSPTAAEDFLTEYSTPDPPRSEGSPRVQENVGVYRIEPQIAEVPAQNLPRDIPTLNIPPLEPPSLNTPSLNTPSLDIPPVWSESLPTELLTGADLAQYAKTVQSQPAFEFFVRSLLHHWQCNPQDWANQDLSSYLAALAAVLPALQADANPRSPREITWRLAAELLLTATKYSQ
jgi:transcriptional regulator with XRE-family HTH domain